MRNLFLTLLLLATGLLASVNVYAVHCRIYWQNPQGSWGSVLVDGDCEGQEAYSTMYAVQTDVDVVNGVQIYRTNVGCLPEERVTAVKDVGYADYPFQGFLLRESADGNRRLAQNDHALAVLIRGAGQPTIIYDLDAHPLQERQRLFTESDEALHWVEYRIMTVAEFASSSKTHTIKPAATHVEVSEKGGLAVQVQGQTLMVHVASSSSSQHSLRLILANGQVLGQTTYFTGNEGKMNAPASGIYLLQVDGMPSQKVIVP